MPSLVASTRRIIMFTVLLGAALPAGAELVRVVKEIEPIPQSGTLASTVLPYGRFVPFGGRLLFVANNGLTGPELWATDGTTAGTVLVKDVVPGPGEGSTRGLAALGSVAIFRVDSGPQAGLWRTDGTAGGSSLVKKVVIHGPEAWSGVADVAGSPSRTFTVVSRVAFFVGQDAAHGVELWRTDGTPAGTGLVKDLSPGPVDAFPAWPVAAAGRLFFRALAPTNWRPLLYSTDGTPAGTKVVKAGVAMETPVVARGKVFFVDIAGTRPEIWVSDGSPSGTKRLTRFAEGGQTLRRGLASSGSAVFFTVDTGSGVELWTSDGTEAGTHSLLEDEASLDGTPAALGGRLFFLSTLTGDLTLWKTDGTPAGTQPVKDLGPFVGNVPLVLEAAARRLFFACSDGGFGMELWTSDGTEPGTRIAASFALPSPSVPVPGGVSRLGSSLLFGGPADRPASPITQLLAIAAPVDVSVQDVRTSRTGCTPTADFKVTLSSPSEETVTVNYATADGTARAGRDYLDTSGTLTFLPGSTSGVVTVPLRNDLVPERTARMFFLDLAQPSNAGIDRGRAKATVWDGGSSCLRP
jgi:ELWxxDGT repeat protein